MSFNVIYLGCIDVDVDVVVMVPTGTDMSVHYYNFLVQRNRNYLPFSVISHKFTNANRKPNWPMQAQEN